MTYTYLSFHDLDKQLCYFVGVVYHELPMLHAVEAGDVAMWSECLEMTEHVLGHKGFVLTIPVVHVGTAYALEARGIDGLVVFKKQQTFLFL